MSYFELPKDWADTLALIQTKFPEAVIAGGALRDTIMQKPVSDIDIFVKAQGAYTEAHLKTLFGDGVEMVSKEWTTQYGEHLPELDSVWDIKRRDGQHHPFQIIALNMDVTPDTTVARFDFGICRVAHNGKQLLITDAFASDADNHTFTALRVHNKGSTWDRYYRFTEKGAKYDGWKLSDPQELLKAEVFDFDTDLLA
jgi:hypothetical protein